ncbi:MAG: O-antigen ligase family protein [Pirellulaceae bacterium]|nr:O-antigen ligase family protein [Planctomycetales bacterium]
MSSVLSVAESDVKLSSTQRVALWRFSEFVRFWLPTFLLGLLAMQAATRLEYAQFGADKVYHDEAVEVSSSNRLRQIGFLSFGALGAYLLIRREKEHDKNVYWPIILCTVLTTGFICLSVVWSDDPNTTLKRSILISCMLAGAVGLGSVWRMRDVGYAIVILSSLFLTLGVAAEIYYGTFLAGVDYRFCGIFHPAKQAFSCALLLLASCSLYQLEKRKLFLVIACVAFIFLVLTKARTGTAALLVAAAWFWWHYLSSRTILLSVWGTCVAVAVALIVLGGIGGDVSLETIARMGRKDELADPTKLTGRLPIWSEAMELFADRPLFGYGYGAFWIPQRVRHFERLTGWAFSHAHSGYIETLVNLGVVGLFLGLSTVLVTFRRCLRLIARHDLVLARFASAVLILAIIGNISESAFIADGYEVLVALTTIALVGFQGTPVAEELAS